MRLTRTAFFIVPCVLSGMALVACGPTATPDSVSSPSEEDKPSLAASSKVPQAFTWPASLKPFGEGYPDPGNPCRRVGESAAVADLLDHTRVLVGCPGRADEPAAAAVLADGQGKALAYIDGVTLIAVPPNASM